MNVWKNFKHFFIVASFISTMSFLFPFNFFITLNSNAVNRRHEYFEHMKVFFFFRNRFFNKFFHCSTGKAEELCFFFTKIRKEFFPCPQRLLRIYL